MHMSCWFLRINIRELSFQLNARIMLLHYLNRHIIYYATLVVQYLGFKDSDMEFTTFENVEDTLGGFFGQFRQSEVV